MHKERKLHPHTSVAIIGAGFSGTMLAVNIVKKALRPIQITLIEKSGQFGPGVAYKTSHPYHFLNVRAGKMGAFAEDPEHFYQWLQANREHCSRLFPECAIGYDRYVPRRLYGLYLESLLDHAKVEAKAKGITLVFLTAEAIAAEVRPNQLLQITLNDQSTLTAEAIVLATNLPSYRTFATTPDVSPGTYVDNIWDPPANSLLKQASLAHLAPSTRVAIIGSCLTMVDTVISLLQKGYQGEIVVISKHGIPPQPHLEKPPEHIPPPANILQAKNLSKIMLLIRNEIATASENGIDWRAVIDSLRPVTVPLWKAFPLDEKKRFLKHFFSLWNRVRHRIPPVSYQILQSYQKQGKLQFIASCVTGIERAELATKVCVMGSHPVEADYILNCSGAHKNIHKVNNPLLQNLLKQEIITANALNMGIDVDEHYKVIGKHNLPIYALGQLLLGQRMESIAIPELREQCASIAEYVAKHQF